ncbi:MAG: hypothetical protein HY646_00615 [Acidobacteria bacterium]|nr:hypothetical protein [Acidobacteriota bacterium]
MNDASRVRLCILGVLVLGLLGTITELLLIAHYEDDIQLLPIFLTGFALAVAVWNAIRPSAASVRVLQTTMMLFLFSGMLGMSLHYRGAAEFQLELDPEMSAWDVFKRVMRVKAPPVLAPGIMLHLGLIGLTYGYRHPALTRPISQPME